MGVGITNSTGYELIARKAKKFIAIEPFIKINKLIDSELKQKISQKYQISDFNNMVRYADFSVLENNSVDLIVSNSVFEHVTDPEKLIRELKRIIKHDGFMLHIIDYRDHFFKYPYHFLKYSNTIWDRFLNPGDLPRTRVSTHVELFEKNNLITRIIYQEKMPIEFDKIKSKIHKDFCSDIEKSAITKAVLFVKTKSE